MFICKEMMKKEKNIYLFYSLVCKCQRIKKRNTVKIIKKPNPTQKEIETPNFLKIEELYHIPFFFFFRNKVCINSQTFLQYKTKINIMKLWK